MASDSESFAVAIVGGATAGAEAAGMLADRGVTVVVFEQNPRPYGKIEDGLPRWHVKLRRKEYETINARVTKPGVHFVPLTKVGRDIDLRALVDEWGFSAVVLAHGAWRDRPLPVEGADAFVDKGLVYQNPFIYWFNHSCERRYAGPQYTIGDGAIVVGGGLASLDVMKVLQVEMVRRALEDRGIDEDALTIEAEGVAGVLGEHGFSWSDLGLRGATLFYRRRIEDMPLAEMPDDVDPARQEKVESTRRRILEKAMQKYGFSVRPLRTPVGLIVKDDRLVGLKFQHTRVENGKAIPIDGAFDEVRGPMVISSIGSIPEPLDGIPEIDGLYRWADPHLGRLDGFDTLFSTGNVVTGKGNIIASRKHSVVVTNHVIGDYFGLLGEVRKRPGLTPAAHDALLARVRERQAAVGYTVPYKDWLERVTPPDLA